MRKKSSKKDDLEIFELVRQKIKLKALEERKRLHDRHESIKTFTKENGLDLSKLRDYSTHALASGAVAGALLLAPVNADHLIPHHFSKKLVSDLSQTKTTLPIMTTERLFMEELSHALPATPRPLSQAEETRLESLFEKVYGVKAKATLDGEHLNTTYGRIGAEQHLRRYPGDSLSNHGSLADQKEGIAPGLGAWGYFAPSKEKLTPQLVETEKWYAVVQTLYLPDWNVRFKYLREWYKYRKVLIVNTDNGHAVVAAIADSGPAAWTGKHFGGSPEVMDHLGGPRYKKGPVVLFFVDDPDNKVKLGPVSIHDNIPVVGEANPV